MKNDTDFRVVQFLLPWSGHSVGDRCPMRAWLANTLAAQGVVRLIVPDRNINMDLAK